ncbi:MAG: YjfB family protein [Lachnospiraceae bacterium]|nr:YjfB family protein [Lachnospiraceae bacterium]MBQ9234347.1 YjfB family protein [Lachnospiraceae bacterium]
MNISSLGNSGLGLQISDTRSMNEIDIAMLKKSLDAVETNGDMITQMMERSVNPNIGANIDIRL